MGTALTGPGGLPQLSLGDLSELRGTPGTLRTPPAGFGEHTIAVLQELGYTVEEIDRLAREVVI